MFEIKRLGYYWAPDLYKFLVKHKEITLISQRDLFLLPPQGVAIAAVNGRNIIQLLLCRLENTKATTVAIIGDYGLHTIDLLDQLCAICSSNEPLVFEHKIIISKDFDKFESAWLKSRLGKMETEHSREGQLFSSKIGYPEI